MLKEETRRKKVQRLLAVPSLHGRLLPEDLRTLLIYHVCRAVSTYERNKV